MSAENGAFAARKFRQNEIVEVAPVLLLSTPYSELEEKLRRRVFNWGRLGGKIHGFAVIAFGYGSMYNHSNPANMRYSANNDKFALIFTAGRNIGKHEELTINHNAIGGGHTWFDDNWFERHNVERL